MSPGTVTFKILPHTGNVRGMTLPCKYSLAGLVATEGTAPGTLAGLNTAIQNIAQYLNGSDVVHDGAFASLSLALSGPGTFTRPTGQTRKDKVRFAYRVSFTTSSEIENHSFELPCPDLPGDWTFPAGSSRVEGAAITTVFSATAVSFMSALTSYLLNWGMDDVSSMSLIYVEHVD